MASKVHFTEKYLTDHISKGLVLFTLILSNLMQSPEILQQFALETGFFSSKLRKKAWPLLLGIDVKKIPQIVGKSAISHNDLDQVEKDIERSLWKFTVGKEAKRQNEDFKSSFRNKLRYELSLLINTILTKNPELRYYQVSNLHFTSKLQGFHDIASIFMLIAQNANLAYAMIEKVAMNHIRYP